MDLRTLLTSWPVVKQLTGTDRFGLRQAAQSEASAADHPRTAHADRTVQSVCPYCAVGCGQRIHVTDNTITHIEGDPDSPVSRGRLCPRGSASLDLVAGPGREYRIKYRPPYGTEWEELDLDTAIDMIADRVIAARETSWQDRDDEGNTLNRTLQIANLGGAALDNEENYLIKKLFTALGAIQIENQARI